MKRLLILLAICLTSCTAGKYVVFNDGTSDYSIVVDPDAGESVQYAACELQHWIGEVSGATLPIVGLDGGQEGKRLVVGCNAITKEIKPDAEEPESSDDSFTWCNVGGDILLWGGAKRGTLYAVYSFLEEELGVRWYSSQVSVAPKTAKYSFTELFNTESPSIKVRDDLYLDVITNPDFSGKLRNNHVPLTGRDGKVIPFSSERFWGVHTFDMMVPKDVYFDSHPEYYSLRDGKRVKEGYTQLCLSNPDVLRITIESMRKVMRENPDYLIYSLTQNDNYDYCECPECQAIADQYGGQSGLMIWFVNQVADALKDEFPDKYIGTFAYQYTRGVPKGIQPRENVVVRLCSIECCLIHNYDECEQNQAFLNDMQGWSAISPHLFIWDYTTAFSQYSLPVPNFKTAKPHIHDFVENKAIGMMEEGDYQTKCGEFNELKAYLLAKLMWNCDADPEAIIKDFTDGYYGPAGKYIREYIEFADRILRRDGIHMNCYPYIANEVYSEEFIRGAREIFQKAKEAVADKPDYFSRVESAEFPILLLFNEKMHEEAMQCGTFGQIMHVIEKDGVTKMAEHNNIYDDKTFCDAQVYLGRYKVEEDILAGKIWPAVDAECGEPGVAYKYYEGSVFCTGELATRTKLMDEGMMPAISIPGDPARDHFGYDFSGLIKVEEDGIYTFTLTSDDGSALLIDGNLVISNDSAHDPETRTGRAPLASGVHEIRVLYFEDCNGQVLELSAQTPSEKPMDLIICQPRPADGR